MKCSSKVSVLSYKISRILRQIAILIYILLAFFEKPFFCWEKIFFYKQTVTKCNENTPFSDIFVIPQKVLSPIELVLDIILLVSQLTIQNQKEKLELELTKSYLLKQRIICVLIIICMIDIIISLIINAFPIINFTLRFIIIILSIQRLREEWKRLLISLWNSKKMIICLICSLFLFGIISNILFHKSKTNEFKTVLDSTYSLMILLSTCNFPNVMLNIYDSSQWGTLFFVVFIIINYLIILAILKAMFFSGYFDVSKMSSDYFLNQILKERDSQLPILRNDEFFKSLLDLKFELEFTDDEFEKILSFCGLDNLSIPRDKHFIKFDNIRTNLRNNNLISFFSFKIVGSIIVIIEIILIFLYENFGLTHNFMNIIYLIWCFIFLFESMVYVHYIPFKKLLKYMALYSLFSIINIISITALITCEIFYILGNNYNASYEIAVYYTKIIISFRNIRFFILLFLFDDFKTIFFTLKNMKRSLYNLFLTLLSFFYSFSTITMLFRGGAISIGSFVDNLDIPNNYFHLNFNDMGSSFITCFALTMINNLQIMTESLSYGVTDSIRGLIKTYFSLFYFISSLMILNICATLLLEVFLTLKSKKVKYKNIIN